MSLGGTIDIPKLGSVPKPAAIAVGAAAVGFIGWRWWKARNAPPADQTATDPGFEDPGALPTVPGASGVYGGTTGGTGSDQSGAILTNAQWSNDVLAKLTGTGAYEAGDVADALGAYLAGRPLTSDQQRIVQAAIAVSGKPPVGDFTLIPGGDTGLMVAPSGLSATGVTTTTASITFTGVPGAAGYTAVVNGVDKASASSSPIALTGLTQNTAYTVHVVAKTAAGKASPDSPSVTFKTLVAGVGAPTGLHVPQGTTQTLIPLSWNPVAGAKGYQILVNGKQNGNTVTFNGGAARYLKKGTRYTLGVRAINANNTPGPTATITASTKK